MARPLNSTKPLYQTTTPKVGRPLSARFTIGFIGPDLESSSADDLQQSLLIGQLVAKQSQIVATFADQGTALVASKGARQLQGQSLGFSDAKTQSDHVQRQPAAFVYDSIIYAGSNVARQKLFFETVDALIIMAHHQPLDSLSQPFTKTIPIGVLISSRDQSHHVNQIVELAQASHSLIQYSDNPKELVIDILKQLKGLRNEASSR